MKKKVLIWEITGFLVVCALSGVFHFIYDWSGKQTWIGFFCPVNESTWEHLKLLFFPVLIFSAIEYIWIRKESDVYKRQGQPYVQEYLSPISSPFLQYRSVWLPRRNPVTSISNEYSSLYHFFIYSSHF